MAKHPDKQKERLGAPFEMRVTFNGRLKAQLGSDQSLPMEW
jgi:hypothetical protein